MLGLGVVFGWYRMVIDFFSDLMVVDFSGFFLKEGGKVVVKKMNF